MTKYKHIDNIINTKTKEREREKMKNLYPNLYLKKVEDITIENLIKNKIKLLILVIILLKYEIRLL